MNVTFFISSGNILRAINAMDTAPAVCELEGPIIFGPITSKILKKFIIVVLLSYLHLV